MSRPLRVWSWIGHRYRLGHSQNQTEEVCAARSMAAVARAAGVKYPRELFCLGETGNLEHVRVAMSKPGCVFWRSLDGRIHGEPWRESKERRDQ